MTTDALEQIIEHSTSSRDRIFTPLVTLKAFIFQVLSTDGSCRQAVNHVLSEGYIKAAPPQKEQGVKKSKGSMLLIFRLSITFTSSIPTMLTSPSFKTCFHESDHRPKPHVD